MGCDHASATGGGSALNWVPVVDRGAVLVLGSLIWVVSHLWCGLPALPLWVSLALPLCMLICALSQLVYIYIMTTYPRAPVCNFMALVIAPQRVPVATPTHNYVLPPKDDGSFFPGVHYNSLTENNEASNISRFNKRKVETFRFWSLYIVLM